ncbi:MAG TPA: alcohol dehydrogenase catalytic domain-containing protein [Anaerolineae bacterium]|nr:alcohol dehydrogenase catalytic domain-containing protein [Anaerolineae bacterium]
MRALVLDGNLRLETDRPVPATPAGEALIRVLQAGICNTDLELVKGYMAFKGVPGHEFVGVVESVSESASAPSAALRGSSRDASYRLIGRRVVGEINAACRTCETCRAGRPTHCPNRTTLGIDRRDGAFADYLTLPFENLRPVPDTVTHDQAVFVEPLAAACEIMQQVHIQPTDRVVVIGDGKLGLLCAQVLQLTGCYLVALGRHAEKLDLLARRGIRVATSPDDVDRGADVVVEATGSPAGFDTARQLVRPRGTIVLKSTYQGELMVNLTKVVVDEVALIGSRCGPFEPALRLLEQKSVDVESLIHARYSLDDGLAAFERAAAQGTLKVMLELGHG